MHILRSQQHVRGRKHVIFGETYFEYFGINMFHHDFMRQTFRQHLMFLLLRLRTFIRSHFSDLEVPYFQKSGHKTINNILIWIAHHFSKQAQTVQRSLIALQIFYVTHVLAFSFLRLTGLYLSGKVKLDYSGSLTF